MQQNKKVGLSLSGGGYRATVYHLGTLRALKKLNILDKVDVISTNSGGSITGATYGLYENDFEAFEHVILKGVKSSVIKGVLTSWRFLVAFISTLIWLIAIVYFLFTPFQWLSVLLLLGFIIIFSLFQFRLFPISKLNERLYNRFFFNEKKLSDLTSKKLFAINATNLETGRLFTFSKERMGDSTYEYPEEGNKVEFNPEDFPIARAVAASTCVPFVFTPIKIGKEFYKNASDISVAKPRLIDGGIYDNQAAHKLTQNFTSYSCDYIIISDAGNAIPFKNTYLNTLTLLIRTSNIFMNRIKNMQMIDYLYKGNNPRCIAYQSLGWDLEDSIPKFIQAIKDKTINQDVLEAHKITQKMIDDKHWESIKERLKTNSKYHSIVEKANSKADQAIARSVKTNLVPLKDKQIEALINHAALLTELQVRLYCPMLLN
ncbi:patatin-like phospholipase family protein [Lacinutrix salivirga]